MNEPYEEPIGLSDRVDDLLLKFESWCVRARPILVASGFVLVAVAVAWWALQTPGRAPVEDAIPLARPESASPGSAASVPSGAPVSGLAAAPTGAAGDGSPGPVDPSGVGSTEARDRPEEPAVIVVHVVGAVRRPGLVVLEPPARVSDAVTAAGGPLPGAHVDRLNLATPLVDGMQIRVPTAADPGAPEPSTDGAPDPDEPLIRLPAPTPTIDDGAPASTPIDLNRASPSQLEALPGIGPALAAAIVEWRTGNGGFTAVDDLEDVPGIGPAKLAALRDRVTV